MVMTPAELAFRTALANPRPTLEFIDRLLGEQVEAAIAQMSDAEMRYLQGLLLAVPEGKTFRLSEEERAILAEMRELREAGEIPIDHREYRKSEGWWVFSIVSVASREATGCRHRLSIMASTSTTSIGRGACSNVMA